MTQSNENNTSYGKSIETKGWKLNIKKQIFITEFFKNRIAASSSCRPDKLQMKMIVILV